MMISKQDALDAQEHITPDFNRARKRLEAYCDDQHKPSDEHLANGAYYSDVRALLSRVGQLEQTGGMVSKDAGFVKELRDQAVEMRRSADALREENFPQDVIKGNQNISDLLSRAAEAIEAIPCGDDEITRLRSGIEKICILSNNDWDYVKNNPEKANEKIHEIATMLFFTDEVIGDDYHPSKLELTINSQNVSSETHSDSDDKLVDALETVIAEIKSKCLLSVKIGGQGAAWFQRLADEIDEAMAALKGKGSR